MHIIASARQKLYSETRKGEADISRVLLHANLLDRVIAHLHTETSSHDTALVDNIVASIQSDDAPPAYIEEDDDDDSSSEEGEEEEDDLDVLSVHTLPSYTIPPLSSIPEEDDYSTTSSIPSYIVQENQVDDDDDLPDLVRTISRRPDDVEDDEEDYVNYSSSSDDDDDDEVDLSTTMSFTAPSSSTPIHPIFQHPLDNLLEYRQKHSNSSRVSFAAHPALMSQSAIAAR